MNGSLKKTIVCAYSNLDSIALLPLQIRRLLSGRVELWELIMTGGLWRVTGEQVAQQAVRGRQGGPAVFLTEPFQRIQLHTAHNIRSTLCSSHYVSHLSVIAFLCCSCHTSHLTLFWPIDLSAQPRVYLLSSLHTCQAEGTAQEGEEVRGPHANLAVKLVKRDSGRTFLLGGWGLRGVTRIRGSNTVKLFGRLSA